MIEKKKDYIKSYSNGEKLSNTKGIIRCNHIIDKK
jgi:tRNA A58 N-methylase Trm61